MIDGYDFFYGNKTVELGFKVTITPQLVEYLENCGCLEEDEVDENIYDETDSDYYNDMAQPVYDAIIDYYLDRAESTLEVECDKMHKGEVYDEEFVNLSSDVDRVLEVAMCDPIWYGIGGFPLVECHYHYDKREN